MSADRDFDWADLDGAEVVIEHQALTAIYRNPRGHIVMRQEGRVPPDAGREGYGWRRYGTRRDEWMEWIHPPANAGADPTGKRPER